MSSCQASKEKDCWSALSSLSQSVKKALTALPDGDELLDQICEPLKHKSSFEESASFAMGMHKASRIQFWEMVLFHVETIKEALAGVSL